jgi:hypothetical protein
VSFSRRVMTLPGPAFFLLLLVAGEAAAALVSWSLAASFSRGMVMVFGLLIAVAALVGAVGVAVRRHRLRAEGRWEASLDATDAFLDRRPPADQVTRSELVRVTAAQRRALWAFRWGPPLFGVLALLQVPAALDHPRAWIMVAVFAGVGAAYPVLHRRNRDRVEAAERNVAGA